MATAAEAPIQESGPAVCPAGTARAIHMQGSLDERTCKNKTVMPAKTHTTANQWQDLVLVYMIAKKGGEKKRTKEKQVN